MPDVPKKTPAKPATKPLPSGKGVALTARQALQEMEKATASVVKPAPAKTPAKLPVAAKPVKVAEEVKAPFAAKPVAAKTVAPKPPVAQVPAVVTALIAEPEAIKPVAVAPVSEVAAPKSLTPVSNTPTPEMEQILPTATAEGTKAMNDVIENTKKYTEEAKTRFQSAFSDMNEKAKSSVEKSTKAVEEMTEIAKGNVEAMVESGKIAAKGMEAMGQDAAEYSRMTFEKASATMKSLAAVKSPTEFFQLQSEMLSSAFDAFAKESAKTSEAMIKLAGEVAQPLSSRMSVMTEKVKSLAA